MRAALLACALACAGAGTARAQLAGPKSAELRVKEPQWALGARLRGVWVTPAMLSPFLATSTPMQNASLGLELIYRRLTFDVVTSLDFSFVSPADGNFLSANHDPAVDSHFVHFDTLSVLSADVSIIGHTWLTDWLELRYGAGVGLGLTLGSVWVINNGPQCTAANAGDIAACHPTGVDLTSPQRQQMLDATKAANQRDTAQTPHYHLSSDVPPVVPIVNVLMGLSFRLHKHASAQLEVGFRDAIFFGVGAHYWF